MSEAGGCLPRCSGIAIFSASIAVYRSQARYVDGVSDGKIRELRHEVAFFQQRTSLTRLIEEGLQLRLRTQAAPQRGKLRLPVFKGRGGLAAGVDPLSNKAMLAALGDDA